MFISVKQKDCLYHFSSRFFSSQNAMAARSHARQAFATFTRLKNPILGLILSYMHISVKHARVKKTCAYRSRKFCDNFFGAMKTDT